MQKILQKTKYIAIPAMLAVLVFSAIPANAQTAASAPVNPVDQVLCSMGLGGCASVATSTMNSNTSAGVSNTNNNVVISPVSSGFFGGSSRSSLGIFYG